MILSEARILHISKYYYPFRGGTEQVARDMVRALLGTGAEQKVICFNEDAQDGEIVTRHDETVTDRVDGVEVIRCGYQVKMASQSVSAGYGRELRRVMDSFQPNVVVLHYPNPYVTCFLMKYRKRDFKLLVYWHLDIVKQKLLRLFFAEQNRNLVRRADRLIATSENYIEGSPWLSSAKEKCIVIPNCINLERLRITPEAEEKAAEIRETYKGKILCFAVGRHTEYKGYRYLIRAARLLDDRFRVVIAGCGEETESLKEEAGEDVRILFTGRLEDTDLMGFFKAMDIFCFPSVTKNEAFGVALAEGMYYEKPAVTFTIPGSGVNYVCLNGKTGMEVPNRDVEAYADALRTLASDRERREKMGKAARKRVEENFLDTQFRENIRNLLTKL
ncbi:MAG: glycosyltransferase [Oscillospiraceae bacterium]|nr:glycosyltransferase [Oscillospiraceae bacterium]